jgi:hypothetical protein
MQLESFSMTPLQQIAYAYLYSEYSGDENIQPFFDSYNSLAQGYLEWFNSTPLSVYTNNSINGPLLDWIGEGIYGIARPVISTSMTKKFGAYNTNPYNTIAYNRNKIVQSGTATIASDDIYKRTLTWHLYLGDGRQMSIMWLRRRVARFLFGVNGADIPVDYLTQISIARPPSGFRSAYGTYPYNTTAYNARSPGKNAADHSIQITIPPGPVAQTFQALVNEGYLALPFQVKFTVVIS